ncbi:MAG: exosome complex RNA-binding protein Rrp4 [Nanoarchaeota archaeon]
MSELKVKEKDIVVPGEIIATGMDFLPSQGTVREGENLVATCIGVVNIEGRVIKVIALNERYMPKPGDVIVGKVIDISFGAWFLEIGCAMNATLPMRETPEFIETGSDLTRYYTFGDYLVAKIIKTTRTNVDITMKDQGLRRLGIGKLLYVSTAKVPRIIGKQGSMISMIKEKTNCRIVVGKNGWIWIQGEPEDEQIAAEAIRIIDENAHKEGLTERIESFVMSKKQGGEKNEAQ